MDGGVVHYRYPLRTGKAASQTLKGAGATTLYGARATESAIKRGDLARYRYIHLATHGVLGGRNNFV